MTEIEREMWRQKARDAWEDEGNIEIDDDARISVSEENDGGYVQAWVWVNK